MIKDPKCKQWVCIKNKDWNEHWSYVSQAIANLQKIKLYVKVEWPKFKDNVSPQLQPYWETRDEIHREDDMLFAWKTTITQYLSKRQWDCDKAWYMYHFWKTESETTLIITPDISERVW